MLDGARAVRRRAACRSSGSSRRASSGCATSSRRCCPGAGQRRGRRARRCTFEEFLVRERGGRTLVAARSSASPLRARARPRPLPPESVRRDAGRRSSTETSAGLTVDVDAVELLRHGRRVRLPSASTSTSRCGWPRPLCCRPCATPAPTPSSSPTARAAGTRSTTARSATRCTSRACSPPHFNGYSDPIGSARERSARARFMRHRVIRHKHAMRPLNLRFPVLCRNREWVHQNSALLDQTAPLPP